MLVIIVIILLIYSFDIVCDEELLINIKINTKKLV